MIDSTHLTNGKIVEILNGQIYPGVNPCTLVINKKGFRVHERRTHLRALDG